MRVDGLLGNRAISRYLSRDSLDHLLQGDDTGTASAFLAEHDAVVNQCLAQQHTYGGRARGSVAGRFMEGG